MVMPVADPVIFTVTGADVARCELPRNAAETRSLTRPGVFSNIVVKMLNILSPATASPFKPSSCNDPRLATRLPLASILSRLTLPGTTEGLVIEEVTVTTSCTPTGVELGVIVVVPIVPPPTLVREAIPMVIKAPASPPTSLTLIRFFDFNRTSC